MLQTMNLQLIRTLQKRHLRIIFFLIVAILPLAPLLAGFAQTADREVVVGHIEGTITPVMARYVDRVIKEAEKDDAIAVVFEMDTPGGLSSAMDDIIRDILESDVPVVVYVTPRGARAASAGVYISYAAHVSAMAPGTNIGSASPIMIGADGSTGSTDDTLERKITNDAVAQIKNLAELRGRNAEWAESAVRDAVNITADEAVALGVIDLTAPDLDSLIAMIDGRTVQLESGAEVLETSSYSTDDVDMSLAEQLLQLLADPTIAYLLISLGLLGIYVELSSPGITFPGIFGTISVIIGLFSLGTVPVNWTGILLMVFAFILFAAEIYVPSFGTLTIGGVVSFVIGSYLLLGEDAPPGYEIGRPVIWAVTGCMVAFSLFLGASVLKTRLSPPVTGKEMLIGSTGIVRQSLDPDGVVLVFGELWSARLEPTGSKPLPVDQIVTVTRVHGLRIGVRAATEVEIAHHEMEGPDPRLVIPGPGVLA